MLIAFVAFQSFSRPALRRRSFQAESKYQIAVKSTMLHRAASCCPKGQGYAARISRQAPLARERGFLILHSAI
jgi:hypothetical protein